MAKAKKRVNKSPLSMREGEVYIDGVLVADSCAFQLVFTPKVWKGNTLSRKGTDRRYIGYDITGKIKEWKTNNRLRTVVNQYIKNGETPEFTITGICDDKNSDYYQKNGTDKVTAIGCVFEGDLTLMDLDTDGEVVKENIDFGAFDLA